MLLPASTQAQGHFDVIPGQTLTVNNTSGQTLGPISNVDWAGIANGSKVFDFNQVSMARMQGEITDAVGSISGWPGTWITSGLYEQDWIDGAYVNDPDWDPPAPPNKPNSYRIGWIGTSTMVLFPGQDPDPLAGSGDGVYQDHGFRSNLEDTRMDNAHWEGGIEVGTTTGTPQIQFQLHWDMSAYDISDAQNPSYGLSYLDYNDPNNTAEGWYSEENGGELFPTAGLPTGRRHGVWGDDPTHPMYYDDYSDTLIGVSIVEDNDGNSGSVTFGDITFDVVGRVAGDADLDGDVDLDDRDILMANVGSTEGHWGIGDFTGGGEDDWGGLDGLVDGNDAQVIADALGLLGGDFNLDESVDVVDLGILATNYNVPTGMTILEGDANQDGAVDVVDLGILATNYGVSLQTAQTMMASVPEPGTGLLLALAAFGLLLKRRRK
jgi:hypothetical protein